MTAAANSEIIRLCKFLRVPRQQVYDAWLDPESRGKWWGADVNMCCTRCEIEPRVGGRYRVGMSNPKHGPDAPHEPAEYVSFGTFTELDPPSRMAFTWAWEEGPNAGEQSLVTLDFFESEHDGKPATELVLTHSKLRTAALRSDHGSGWMGCLRNLGYHFHDTWPEPARKLRAAAVR